mgnify:CR=1 FL=1
MAPATIEIAIVQELMPGSVCLALLNTGAGTLGSGWSGQRLWAPWWVPLWKPFSPSVPALLQLFRASHPQGLVVLVEKSVIIFGYGVVSILFKPEVVFSRQVSCKLETAVL